MGLPVRAPFFLPMTQVDNITRVLEILAPIVTEEGCELIDAEITFDSGRKTLRLFVDKPGGVQLEDCSRISHSVEDLLEVENLVSGRYNLEVSSPGINRPLKTQAHFEAVVGQTVSVTTKEKINNRAHYKGTNHSCA